MWICKQATNTYKLSVKVKKITDSGHPEFIVQEYFHKILRPTERFKEAEGCYEISDHNCHFVVLEDNSA